jgi:hypothetical protein
MGNMSPMAEANKRFNECHPARQLLNLLDRVERIEKILDEAFKVKTEGQVKEVLAKRRGRPPKNVDS